MEAAHILSQKQMYSGRKILPTLLWIDVVKRFHQKNINFFLIRLELLWPKNGECFARLRLIKVDLESNKKDIVSNKRRLCNTKIDTVK